MYPFDSPFWMKMFFICMVAGIAFFVSELMACLPKAKKDFWIWKEKYFKNEYPKVKAESNRILREMKKKILGRKVLPIFLAILLIISILPIFSRDVSATTLNCTWKPTSGILASTAANWENGSAPTAGDNIYFISSWVTSCTYDISTSVGAFNIRTEYSGTITQAASFSVTSYSQTAGTFTGGSVWLTDSGDFIKTGGTLNYPLQLSLTGENKVLQFNAYTKIRDLTVTGTYTLTIAGSYLELGGAALLSVSGTLTIASGSALLQFADGLPGSSITGSVTGAGEYRLTFLGTDITAPTHFFSYISTNSIHMYALAPATASRKLTLSEITSFTGTLTIDSVHASYTMTLGTGNYSLSAAGITIGTRGIINAGTSTITDSGNWDSSASSDVASSLGTAKIHLTGVSKTFKQSSVERFGSLFVDTGSSYTLQSNIYCINYWLNGTVTKAGYTVYINNNQVPIFTNYPSNQIIPWLNSYSYDTNATDRENDGLTFGVITNMPNLTVNSMSGILSSPKPQTNSTFYVHLYVTDGNHTTWNNYTIDISYIPTPNYNLILVTIIMMGLLTISIIIIFSKVGKKHG